MFNVSVFCSCRTSSIGLKHACLMSPLLSCAGNCLRLAGACSPSSRFQPFKVISPFQATSLHFFSEWLSFLLHLFAIFVYSQMDLKCHGRQDGSIPNQVWIITQKTCMQTVWSKQMVFPGSRYITDKNISGLSSGLPLNTNVETHITCIYIFPFNCYNLDLNYVA